MMQTIGQDQRQGPVPFVSPERATCQNRGAVEEIETRRFQNCDRLNSWRVN